MTSIEYLSQLKNLELKIMALERQKTYLRGRCQVQANKFKDSPKKRDDKAEDFTKFIDAAIDLQNEIDARIDQSIKLRKEILASLDVITNNTYYAILFERYVNLSTWEVMTEKVFYNYKHLQKLHKQALRVYASFYDFEDSCRP